MNSTSMPRLLRSVLGAAGDGGDTPTATCVPPDVLGGGDGGGVTTGGILTTGVLVVPPAPGLKAKFSRKDDSSHGICCPFVSCSTANRTCLNISSTGRCGSVMKRNRCRV